MTTVFSYPREALHAPCPKARGIISRAPAIASCQWRQVWMRHTQKLFKEIATQSPAMLRKDTGTRVHSYRFKKTGNSNITGSVHRNANITQDSTNTTRKHMGLPFGRKPPVRNCTEVIGDSMVKHIMGHKMNEATGGSEKIFVPAFHGATTYHMNSHCIPTMKKNPNRIVLHCGTNDVSNGDAPEQIAEEVVDLAKAMKNKENTVFVSSIVPRSDCWNAKVSIANRRMKELCAREELPFIDYNNLGRVHHLNRGNLHLNAEGTRLLANNFLRALGHY